MNSKAFVYGIFIGGVVGATAALLSAPSSGRELRSQMKDSKNDWIRMALDLKEDAIDIKNSVAKVSQEGREVIKELASDVKMAVEEWQKDIESNKDVMQQEVKEIQRTIAELEQKLLDHKVTV